MRHDIGVLNVSDVTLLELMPVAGLTHDLECRHCLTHIRMYVTGQTKGFQHPNVSSRWMNKQHPNHKYRVVYPVLVRRKIVLLCNLICPKCNRRGNFKDAEGGMLNLKNLKESFQNCCSACDKPLSHTKGLIRFNKKLYCPKCLSSA